MKRWRKRLVSIALTAVLTLGLSVAAWADNAHFTFTDLYEDVANLYVEKTVTSALEGYTIPDAVFTFVLKWDQNGDGYLEFAENEIYYVYNENGSQVRNETTGSYIFRTDETGRFTLQAGQYAMFEWTGQVEYEITELETDGFIQTSPAGGEAATGIVDEKGTYVTFENLYIPSGLDPDSETTMLAVRKDISWPAGYEMPDLSDVKFIFKITIDGEAYTNEAYTIYDSSMTTREGTARTNGDGIFTLTGGQLALFEEVPVGVDYEVEELATAGWHAAGDDVYAGVTTAPIVYAYFTNTPDNINVLKMPNTGGKAWIMIVLAVCGGTAVIWCVYLYRRRHNGRQR